MNTTASPRDTILSAWFHDQDIDITADIACTLELARAKLLSNEGLSESEMVFFGGVKKFKKNYLKLLDRRRID